MMNWICSFFNYCWKHKKRESWDGYRSYVCPDCAQTPEYKASLEAYLRGDGELMP